MDEQSILKKKKALQPEETLKNYKARLYKFKTDA